MRSRIVRVMSGVLASVLLGAGGASAEPEFRQERVYTECGGSTPVSNVNRIVLAEPVPTWSTEAPAGDTQDGEGCGVLDPLLLVDTQPADNGGAADLSWTGTFTGNLDTILVEAHFLGQIPVPGNFRTQLWIDGVERTGGAATVIEGATVTPSSTGASSKVEFAFTGIGLIDDDEGPGTVEHTITLRLRGYWTDAHQAIAWVWGNTDVPAGLSFNADTAGFPSIEV